MGDLHDASGSLAGYLWQLRQALLLLFRLNLDESITIEKDDDVCIVDHQQVIITAVQAKHSLKKGSLSLRSVDLWKTLRIWSSRSTRIDERTDLILATTHSLAEDLVPFREGATSGPTEKDISTLLSKLDKIAAETPNKKLITAYATWLKLPEKKKRQILRQMRIQDSVAPIGSSIGELIDELRRAWLREQDLEELAHNLIGWFQKVVEERLASKTCKVEYRELWDRVMAFHRRYRALDPPPEPALDTEQLGTAIATQMETENRFAEQLELLGAENDTLEAATELYVRARLARDRWLGEDVVGREQIGRLDRDLTDRWKMERRSAMRGKGKPEKIDDPVARGIGWAIFDACMRYSAPFGRGKAESYFVGGSYHILADDDSVGWHPNYKNLPCKDEQ